MLEAVFLLELTGKNQIRTMVENVRELVKNRCGKNDWRYHILPVVHYAKLLAKMYNADEELAELGALLHDIGWITAIENDPDHEIIGVPIAKEILLQFGYAQEIIDEVTHCVESHRGSKGIAPRTLMAKIIANADAMAHFDDIPGLLRIAFNMVRNDREQAVQWVVDKIERDWKRKLTLPEAKEMMQKKYLAIKLLLDPTRGEKV